MIKPPIHPNSYHLIPFLPCEQSDILAIFPFLSLHKKYLVSSTPYLCLNTSFAFISKTIIRENQVHIFHIIRIISLFEFQLVLIENQTSSISFIGIQTPHRMKIESFIYPVTITTILRKAYPLAELKEWKKIAK